MNGNCANKAADDTDCTDVSEPSALSVPSAALFALCLLWLIPSVASAAPVLVGKSVPGSSIRIMSTDGKVTEFTADKRGGFRVEVPAHFYLEIRHAGYRSVRSSEVSLASDSQ